jgi:hypothetical protein
LAPSETEERGGKCAYWRTPEWTVDALLAIHPPPTQAVVEPSAGEGAIAGHLVRLGYQVTAIEVREGCRQALDRTGATVAIQNWLTTTIKGGQFAVIGNPPYNPAAQMLEHVEHAVSMPGAVYVALLLPIAFFCSSQRLLFNRTCPVTGFYPLAERPVFGRGQSGSRDVAWFVWDDSREQYVSVLTRRR